VNEQPVLKTSEPARDRRLGAADMLTLDQAAKRLGTSTVDVRRMVRRGRAIGLHGHGLGLRLPAWQFEPRIWTALDHLSRELGTKSAWSLLSFLESPMCGLEGRTPRAALEQGEGERVLALARHHV